MEAGRYLGDCDGFWRMCGCATGILCDGRSLLVGFVSSMSDGRLCTVWCVVVVWCGVVWCGVVWCGFLWRCAGAAGNHAQGVAMSAKHLGCKAVIAMPTVTPDIKVNRHVLLLRCVLLLGCF